MMKRRNNIRTFPTGMKFIDSDHSNVGNDEHFLMSGSVTITETDATTGEVLRVDEDHNIVVKTSRNALIRRIAEDQNLYKIRRVIIGSDVGNGTFDDPEPPTLSTTYSDMIPVYDTGSQENQITITYPTPLSISFAIFLSGQQVMQEHPGEDSVGFTSIGLFSMGNDQTTGVPNAFAYRRFPLRSITENINISILWNLYYGDFAFISEFDYSVTPVTRYVVPYDDLEFIWFDPLTGTAPELTVGQKELVYYTDWNVSATSGTSSFSTNMSRSSRYVHYQELDDEIGSSYEYSPITTTAPALLESPPAGWDRIYVDDLPWHEESFSVLEGADPPATFGDVLEWEISTSPSGFEVIMYPDGTFAFGEGDDGSTQSFSYKLWRESDYTWYGPATVTVEEVV